MGRVRFVNNNKSKLCLEGSSFTLPPSLLTSRDRLKAYRRVGRVRFVNNNKSKLGLTQAPNCLGQYLPPKDKGREGKVRFVYV